jgi:hypothetical protein
MTAARYYTGERDTERRTTVTVFEPAAGWSAPLTHFLRHSPAGFEWGYGGSGPADLARALLIDALGPAALCPGCNGSEHVVWTGPDTDNDPEPWHPARHAGTDPELITDCTCDDGIRALPYHDFKFAVVAGWTGDTWTITRAEILDFLTSLHGPGEPLPGWLAEAMTVAPVP